MSGIAWVDGEFVEFIGPSLSVQERGLLYGDGLFETMRLKCGQPLHWEEHLARLCKGCSILKIPFPREEVCTGVKEISKLLKNGVIRLAVTRGRSSERGFLPSKDGKATVIVTGYMGEPYPREAYEGGFSACLISFPRSHLSPLVQLKSLNCLENILGRMEASKIGADEGVFCNYMGEITEGTTSNIFAVINGNLVTPPAESGLLPGIMRGQVLALAKSLELVVFQSRIYPQDFESAEEAFLTNSLFGVMPLVSFAGKPIGVGLPGSISKMLLRKLKF